MADNNEDDLLDQIPNFVLYGAPVFSEDEETDEEDEYDLTDEDSVDNEEDNEDQYGITDEGSVGDEADDVESNPPLLYAMSNIDRNTNIPKEEQKSVPPLNELPVDCKKRKSKFDSRDDRDDGSSISDIIETTKRPKLASV